MHSGPEYLARYKGLKERRQWWHDHWQELADYIQPRRGYFQEEHRRGDKLNLEIFDGTAGKAMELAAAGLYSRATNPASKWFDLRTPHRVLDTDAIKKHLAEIRDIQLSVVNKELASCLYQVYQDLLVFGTACLYIEEDDVRGIRGQVFPLHDIYIQENHAGEVDTVYRKFLLTAPQAIGRWGDKVSQEVKDYNLDQSDHEQLEFLHIVQPRTGHDITKSDSSNMPFESVWMEVKNGHVVESGGYPEFPYAVPRLDVVPGEIYGRSPGMAALPDIKTLNKMIEVTLDAANMQIRPPMNVPDEAYVDGLVLTPGYMNYNDDESGRVATPIHTIGDVGMSNAMIEDRRMAIRDYFFNDQLELRGGGNQTAFEVQQRGQQQMLMMSPWHGRLEKELFEKAVMRSYSILERAGWFPEAPEDLDGLDTLNVIYDSPLARSQRGADISAIDQTIQFAMQFPDSGMMENVLTDETFRARADYAGFPPQLLNDLEAIRANRQAAAEAAAQEEQAAMLAQGASQLAALPGGADIVQQALSGQEGPAE